MYSRPISSFLPLVIDKHLPVLQPVSVNDVPFRLRLLKIDVSGADSQFLVVSSLINQLQIFCWNLIRWKHGREQLDMFECYTLAAEQRILETRVWLETVVTDPVLGWEASFNKFWFVFELKFFKFEAHGVVDSFFKVRIEIRFDKEVYLEILNLHILCKLIFLPRNLVNCRPHEHNISVNDHIQSVDFLHLLLQHVLLALQTRHHSSHLFLLLLDLSPKQIQTCFSRLSDNFFKSSKMVSYLCLHFV